MRNSNLSLYFVGLILSLLSRSVLSGTVYKTILREGQGAVPTVNQTVSVHYTGTLESGTKFDSSHDRNEPFKFKLGVGEVIRGWDAGVVTMRVGERARLEIAPEDAYGVEGLPPVIPSNSKLIFDIELLGVEGGTAPPTVQVQNMAPSQPQTFQNPSQPQGFPGSFTPPSFSTGQGQTFGGETNQGRIFNPPDLPSLTGQGQGQGQEFRGSNIRQNEVVPQPQQTFSSFDQGQPFGQQNQQFPNNSPPGLTFASNQFQGQSGARNPGQGQAFGNNASPVQQPFQPTDNQGQQPFGSSQGQILNPPGAWGNQPGMPNQSPIGPGLSPAFPSSTQPGSSSQSFGGQFPSPSQDISRINPVLSQGRSEPGRQQFPSGGEPRNSPGRPDQFGSGFEPSRFSDIPQGPSPAETNRFRAPSDANGFPPSRFDQTMGSSQGGRVPDLDSVRSVDLRPRFPGGADRQASLGAGSQRDRDMMRQNGQNIPSTAGAQPSMFERPQTLDFTDPRLAGRMSQTRMDPSAFRREMGMDPGFPADMFPGRDFRTRARAVGGRLPSDLFGSRGDPSFRGIPGRFPEIEPRGMRGFPQGRFGRPRDPMMIMMERARRARMMRRF